MHYIEKNISQFIESQFPTLYKEEGPILIEFVKAYFEWMESENNTLYKTRRLLDYRDIDSTLDQYLEHFIEKYAQNFDLNTIADKKLLIKNIQDLYKSKGSERSYEILFRSIYNKDIRFYYPGDDILRVSDGEWIEGKYIEITSFINNIQDFIGKEIRGYKSGASALVENFSQRVINNKIIDVLEISHLKGSFDHGERIYPSNQVGQPIAQILLPRTTGSLTAVGVIDGGSNFLVGDILDISGKGGKGKAKVSSTFSQEGRVTFTLENGGTGYSLDAVTQVFPQMQLTVNNQIGNINVDQLLFSVDGSNNMVANGIVVESNSTVITIKLHTPGFVKDETVRSALKLIMQPTSGTFANGELIYQSNGTANIATGIIISTIPGISNTAYYVANTTGEFVQSVYSISGNTFVVRGNTSSANGFLYETIGGPGTGTAMVANLVGGGVGASFRVGAIYDKEIITINTDYIRNYINTRLMLINESLPLTGTVDVTNGQSNVTGTSTLFTTETLVGGYIQVSNGSSKEIRQVNSITNNTLLTVTENFSNTQTGVSIYADQINYMFPKVSSITDSETLSTILENALTYEELEIGTIQYLSGINPGSGYSLDPYATVIEPLVAALEIISPSGYKGADAVVTATAGTSNGIVMGLSVVDSGFGYEEGEKLEMSKLDSPFAVTGSAIVSEHGKKAGYWKSTKGFLDSDKFIQDSKYYQQFSYEIQTGLNFNSYKDVVKQLLHTAGTEFFGKFYLNNNDLDASILSESIISNTDVQFPNNYPTIRPVFLMDTSEYDIIPEQLTFSRSSTASYFDANGDLQIVANNIPRFGYDPITDERGGFLQESIYINYAFNPWCLGSNTTSPPTDWFISGNGSGLTRTFVDSGYDKGIPYVDIRWQGIPTVTTTANMFFSPNTTQINATSNDVFTTAFYSKLVSGSLDNVNVSRFFTGRDIDGNGFIESTTFPFNSSLVNTENIELRKNRITHTRTVSNTSVYYIQSGVRWSFTAFQPVDVTVRIAAPMCIKGVATDLPMPIFPPIASYNTQYTKQADFISVNTPAWIANSGTLVQKFNVTSMDSSSASSKFLFTIGANTDFQYNTTAFLSQTTNTVTFTGRNGSLQWSLSTPAITLNTNNNIVFSWDTNNVAMTINGGSLVTDNNASLNSNNQYFRIGASYANYNVTAFNGYVPYIAYYSERLSNNELIALSTP